MKIIEYKSSPEEWNKFVIANSSPASFLQSWEWGEFNKQILGGNIIRWAVISEDQKIKAQVLGIKKSLPMGKHFYYCPRGLIYKSHDEISWAEILGLILKNVQAEPRKAVFVRLSPPYEFVDYKEGFFERLGFVKSKILTHMKEPGKTLVLDLSLSVEEMLKQMHSKTRYNIKLALRKGVKIEKIDFEDRKRGIDIFYKLLEETSRRDKIKIYTKDYYTKLLNYFESREGENKGGVQIRQYVAMFGKEILASIFLVYFGKTVVYLHGASSNQQRNLMPNYLIQWRAIEDAKKEGYKYYDFWGISETNPNWAGITRFKKGFGGRTIRYLGTWDLVLHKNLYNLYRLARLARQII